MEQLQALTLVYFTLEAKALRQLELETDNITNNIIPTEKNDGRVGKRVEALKPPPPSISTVGLYRRIRRFSKAKNNSGKFLPCHRLMIPFC
jgi:hypothetical protein